MRGNSRDQVFVETSIHIDRWFGIEERKQRIHQKVAGSYASTSKYIAAEFKRALVGRLIYFHNVLVDSETVGEALKRVGKIPYRTPGTILAVLGEMADNGKTGKQLLLEELDVLIRFVLRDRFHKDVDEVINQIGCIKGDVKPHKSGQLWELNALCSKNKKPKCNTVAFVNKKADYLVRVQEYLLSLKKNGIKRKQAVIQKIDEVLSGKSLPFGRNCQTIADVLIAIECPENATLYTLDRDYVALCDALNKKCYIES